jgi:hypothetical protein
MMMSKTYKHAGVFIELDRRDSFWMIYMHVFILMIDQMPCNSFSYVVCGRGLKTEQKSFRELDLGVRP